MTGARARQPWKRWAGHFAAALATWAAVGCGRTETQRRFDRTPAAATSAAPPTAPAAEIIRTPVSASNDVTCRATLQRGFPDRGEPFQPASASDLQDMPAGGTPDGSSLLVQRGVCSVHLWALVADEIPPGSGSYHIHRIPPIRGMDQSHEEGVTMESDGLTIIGMTSDARGFLAARRSGVGQSDFAAVADDDFRRIVASGSQQLWAPSISADGLAFYYTVVENGKTGIYESLRPTIRVSFPPGGPMPEPVQGLAQYVNGVSADHLQIFLELKEGFGAFVLTRSNPGEPFRNPNAPGPPPSVPGLRTRPLGACDLLIGTCSPMGGCRGEDVCTWTVKQGTDG
jgi:hypothetical protein